MNGTTKYEAERERGPRPAPAQRRDVRMTDRGETIVKHVSTPRELPLGTVVIERGAPQFRAKRFADGWRYLDGNGEADMLATAFGTLDLDYPLTVVREPRKGLYLDRRGRREVEAESRKAQAMIVKRRVRKLEVERLAGFLRSKGIVEQAAPVDGIGESGPKGYVVGPDGVES